MKIQETELIQNLEKNNKLIYEYRCKISELEDQNKEIKEELNEVKNSLKLEEFRDLLKDSEKLDTFYDKYKAYDFAKSCGFSQYLSPVEYQIVNDYFHLTKEEVRKVLEFCFKHNTDEIFVYKNVNITFHFSSHLSREIEKEFYGVKLSYLESASCNREVKTNIYLQRSGPPLGREWILDFLENLGIKRKNF